MNPRLTYLAAVLNSRKPRKTITLLGMTLHRSTAWGIAALD